jgi:hypothetical protein
LSGLEGVALDVIIVWLEGVASDITGILSG